MYPDLFLNTQTLRDELKVANNAECAYKLSKDIGAFKHALDYNAIAVDIQKSAIEDLRNTHFSYKLSAPLVNLFGPLEEPNKLYFKSELILDEYIPSTYLPILEAWITCQDSVVSMCETLRQVFPEATVETQLSVPDTFKNSPPKVNFVLRYKFD